MIRVPVHCCCDPIKRLGSLPIREEQFYLGARLSWRLFFPIRPWWLEPFGRDEVTISAAADTVPVVLEVADLWLEGRNFLAIKSNDTPLETLRRLPGWEEQPS